MALPFAIIGAGLAGISAARALMAQGHAVTIFDKGRGPGGRLATRRIEAEGRKLQFDHGAQYLRAEGADFAAALAEAGTAPWPDAARRVGVPSMSAVPRALLGEIPCVASRHVGKIRVAPAPGFCAIGMRGWCALANPCLIPRLKKPAHLPRCC